MTGFRRKSNFLSWATIFSFAIVCLITPTVSMALDEQSQPEKIEQQEKIYPGLNEVIPQATLVAAKVKEAEIVVTQAEISAAVYEALDTVVEKLKALDKQYTDWENINNWQFNRLRTAKARYTELAAEQKVQLDIIYSQLNILEELWSTWEQEKSHWQEWQSFLVKSHGKAVNETFQHTLSHIEGLLERIISMDTELINVQKKYSAGQEIIANQLRLIDTRLKSLRRDVFQRNTFNIFEADFYGQFNTGLFVGLHTNLSIPISYLKRNSLIFTLLLVSILIITLSLIYRSNQQKQIKEELQFLFNRPLSTAIFLCFYATSFLNRDVFRNMPDGWRWFLTIIITTIAIRLINVYFNLPVVRKFLSTITVFTLITITFRYLDFPTPLAQLYYGLLSAILILLCTIIIRKRSEIPVNLYLLSYLLLAIATTSLAAAILGYERLASTLISATFMTIIFLIIVRIALHLTDGSTNAFIQKQWILDRRFIQALGPKQGIKKIKTLLRIIIIFNAGLSLLVIWRFFDNTAEASDAILGYSYTLGEFTFSVNMIVMMTIVLYLTMLFSWLIQAFIDSQIMTPKKMGRGIKESFKRLTHYGLITIGFLIAVSMAGLELQKFSILAGALGIGIGFGLQNIVNNFVSGLVLLFERPVKVGDVIIIDQDWGTISRIGLRSTVVVTFDRSELIVPNADLIGQKVTNWTYSNKIARANLLVGVEHGSSLEKVLEILIKAAVENPNVLPEPAPSSVFEGFAGSSIDFKLLFWVNNIDDRLSVRTEVAVNIDRLFREANIVIALPQQDLHIRSIDNELQNLLGTKNNKDNSTTETVSD